MNELERIAKVYDARYSDPLVKGQSRFTSFIRYMKEEREKLYTRILDRHFSGKRNIRMIEIGAGTGDNIRFFMGYGIQVSEIYANDLLPERIRLLEEMLPKGHVIGGDASAITSPETYDLVFQSTVFTSILDPSLKKRIAAAMWKMLKPGGIIIWYDFRYNNPKNKDVKGIGSREIRELFPDHTRLELSSCTLAPPIGRRIGNAYPFINACFPFLRSHLVAVIHKY